MRAVVLASASPRRRDLLRAAGFDVTLRPTDVDETPRPGERARDLVMRLARAKAGVVALEPGEVVVAADTTVALDDMVLNKPRDDDDARRMLRRLSGCTHDVLTGVCVRTRDQERAVVVRTRVTFRTLEDDDIEAYLALGEHLDKAGAYGIQAAGSVLVQSVRGSMTNVVGLPVAELFELLRAIGALG